MTLKSILRRVLFALPAWRGFDFAIAGIYFFAAHRRLPSRESRLINDLFFWLKTSKEMDSPLRQFVSDKDLVKVFYRGILLDNPCPETLAKFWRYEDFDQNRLPARCVIKPAHLSGCIFFDRDRGGLTTDDLGRIKRWFTTSMYADIGRERNYRLLVPSVICEEIVAGIDVVKDYKVFCYGGEPRFVQVDVDRHGKHRRRLYTRKWEPLSIAYNKPLAEIEAAPLTLQRVFQIAKAVASLFSFIRVDFYIVNDRIYLGELTSVPENAHGRFHSKAEEEFLMKLLMGKEDEGLGARTYIAGEACRATARSERLDAT